MIASTTQMDWLGALRKQGAQITHLTTDSRQAKAGTLFLAYPGERSDGRAYIEQAVKQGASAVLCEADGYVWNEAHHVPHLAVDGLKQVAGNIADAFYGHPSHHLWMVGVTGTNGKTSCSQWIAQALTKLGRKTGVLGTLGNGFPHHLIESKNTTPDTVLLHGLLADLLAEGADGVAMEVSSHGLDQGRLNGVQFDVAVFTNLSRDHLDYHGDMTRYANAKKKLFEWESLKAAVINADDTVGRQFVASLSGRGLETLTYGVDQGEVRASHIQYEDGEVVFDVEGRWHLEGVRAPVIGRFNVYNILAVLCTLLASGIEPSAACQAIEVLTPVAGRMETLGGGEKPLVVVDYAHTPDALTNALQTLREQTRGSLICVFGCGGDRDVGKRPLMAEAACLFADSVVMTADNPRSESVESIVEDMRKGARGAYRITLDRELAIRQAVAQAKPGDVVLIAGKGHEAYQEIAGIRHPFSDMAVAQSALEQWV